MAHKAIRLTVNGRLSTLSVLPGEMLVDLLRDRLGLTGTKDGCREGECGSCSGIFDGRLITSSLIPAMKADQAGVLTIEGIAEQGEQQRGQKRFVEEGAIQCGFCTPAMALAGKALLDENPHPTREEMRIAISGILCQCTGYQKTITAIDSAARTGK